MWELSSPRKKGQAKPTLTISTQFNYSPRKPSSTQFLNSHTAYITPISLHTHHILVRNPSSPYFSPIRKLKGQRKKPNSMTDSTDRRKRSKWDETERTSSSRERISHHHRDHRQEEREKSVSSRGGSRWDDRRSRSPPPSNPYASRREERRDDHRQRSRSPPLVPHSTGSPTNVESPVKPDPAAAAGKKKNTFLMFCFCFRSHIQR